MIKYIFVQIFGFTSYQPSWIRKVTITIFINSTVEKNANCWFINTPLHRIITNKIIIFVTSDLTHGSMCDSNSKPFHFSLSWIMWKMCLPSMFRTLASLSRFSFANLRNTAPLNFAHLFLSLVFVIVNQTKEKDHIYTM